MAQAMITRRGGAAPKVPYGYEWAYGQAPPGLSRIGAAYGLTATGSVGSTPGASGFDNMPVHKNIRLCNLSDAGTVNAYEGGAGFTRNGTNGEVMVEIPKFWYKSTVDTTNTKATHLVSNKALAGYSVHPAFLHNGATQEYIYVAAYKTSASYHSKTGAAPLVSQTRAATRSGIIAAKNSHWGMIDLATRNAVSLLVRIEFGSHDAQAVCGAGITGAAAAANTGGADSVAAPFGRASGTDNVCEVMWRGIQGWWGNVWEYVDGANWNNGTIYYCLNQAAYADDTATGYTALGYTLNTALSEAYGTRMGYDASAPWAMLPNVFGGSNSTYLCDACFSATGWRVAVAAGGYNSAGQAGINAWTFNTAAASTSALVGSRMIYVP